MALATQLVTAQIAASAQFAASNGLASAIKKVAAEFLMASARINSDLETLGKKPELIDAAFVDHAYANLLAAADTRIPLPELLEPLDNDGLNRLFDGALARAQQLLRSPIEDATVIHAEQLFSPTEHMVERSVGTRFEEWQWPNLKNWDTCYKLMVRIERWFSEHLDELHADDEPWDDDSRRLRWFLNFAREQPEDDLSRKIFDLVVTHGVLPPDAGPRPLSLEKLMAAVWREHFVTFINGNRIPKPRSKKDGKITRHYYPWGLFRYLRLFGECNEEGREILASLSVERKELNADLSPYAIDPKTDLYYSFGPLEHLAKEHEAEVVRKGLGRPEPE